MFNLATVKGHELLLTSGQVICPAPGYLTIRLNPLPTAQTTKAISELCEHLTTTQTRYPGTDLILRYSLKSKKPTNKN